MRSENIYIYQGRDYDISGVNGDYGWKMLFKQRGLKFQCKVIISLRRISACYQIYQHPRDPWYYGIKLNREWMRILCSLG